jgi:hypothetical protein
MCQWRENVQHAVTSRAMFEFEPAHDIYCTTATPPPIVGTQATMAATTTTSMAHKHPQQASLSLAWCRYFYFSFSVTVLLCFHSPGSFHPLSLPLQGSRTTPTSPAHARGAPMPGLKTLSLASLMRARALRNARAFTHFDGAQAMSYFYFSFAFFPHITPSPPSRARSRHDATPQVEREDGGATKSPG